MDESRAFITMFWAAQRRERRGFRISLQKELLDKMQPVLDRLAKRLKALNKLDTASIDHALGAMPYELWMQQFPHKTAGIFDAMLSGQISRREANEQLRQAYAKDQGVMGAGPKITGHPLNEEKAAQSILLELLIEHGLEAILAKIDESPPVKVERVSKETIEKTFRPSPRYRKTDEKESEAARKALGWPITESA